MIPEASTRVAALLAGEVDIIQAVPAELVDTLDQTLAFRSRLRPAPGPVDGDERQPAAL